MRDKTPGAFYKPVRLCYILLFFNKNIQTLSLLYIYYRIFILGFLWYQFVNYQNKYWLKFILYDISSSSNYLRVNKTTEMSIVCLQTYFIIFFHREFKDQLPNTIMLVPNHSYKYSSFSFLQNDYRILYNYTYFPRGACQTEHNVLSLSMFHYKWEHKTWHRSSINIISENRPLHGDSTAFNRQKEMTQLPHSAGFMTYNGDVIVSLLFCVVSGNWQLGPQWGYVWMKREYYEY